MHRFPKKRTACLSLMGKYHSCLYTIYVVNYTYLVPPGSSPFDLAVYVNGPIFLLVPQQGGLD